MAFVTINGVTYDPNIPAQAQAIMDQGYWYQQGQWVPVVPEAAELVQSAPTPIPEVIATADKGGSLQNTIFGTIQNPVPGVMLNTISAGPWSGFDPGDLASGLAVLHSLAFSVYGSENLGTVRYSSDVLENEPTGVRPGTMERIVIPAWARRERGSPL